MGMGSPGKAALQVWPYPTTPHPRPEEACPEVPQSLAGQGSAPSRPKARTGYSPREGGLARLSPPLLLSWLDDEAEQNRQMPPEARRKA